MRPTRFFDARTCSAIARAARALPLVLVREQMLEPRGCFPVDPTDVVSGNILPNPPEVRPHADPTGGHLTEPRTRAAGLEMHAPQVLHRGCDDEPRVDADDRVLGAEGERIEGPGANGPDVEVAFHGGPHGVREGNLAALLERD